MTEFNFIIEKHADDEWEVYLSHQCDAWNTAGDGWNGVPYKEAVNRLHLFIQEA